MHQVSIRPVGLVLVSAEKPMFQVQKRKLKTFHLGKKVFEPFIINTNS